MVTSTQGDTEILVDRNFDSFAELSVMGAGWGTDFRQLNASLFPSAVYQCRISSIFLSHGKFGCHVDQRGTTPPGMRTIAAPSSNCSGMRWFGHIIDSDSLLIFPTHGEIDAQTRSGFDVLTLSVPEQLLAEIAQSNGLPGHSKFLTSAEAVVPANRTKIEPFRRLLWQACGLARRSEKALYDCELVDDIEKRIVLHALELIAGNGIASWPRIKNKHRSLNHILEFIDGHSHRLIRVSELCEVANVSLRTLQILFKQEFGMTLKSYLSGQRLFGAHRELWVASQADVRVLDIAGKWGFSHLSQFSTDYRRIFGELPSTTLATHS